MPTTLTVAQRRRISKKVFHTEINFLQFWTGGQVTRFKSVILSGEVTLQNPMLQEVPEYQNKLCKVLGDGIKIESHIFEREAFPKCKSSREDHLSVW